MKPTDFPFPRAPKFDLPLALALALTVPAIGGGGGCQSARPAGAGAGPSMAKEVPGDEGPQALPGMRRRARVFISGHSLLETPIPEDIELIAQSLGDDYQYELQNLFGTTLAARTRGPNPGGTDFPGYRTGKNRKGENLDVVAELRKPTRLGPDERYDTLLVTERHDIPWSIHAEGTIPALRHYHDRLIDGNREGQTLFTHVWLELDKDNPAEWMAYERQALLGWQCAASKVNLTLAKEGRADRVLPAPGATALVDLVEEALAGRIPGITGTPRQRLDAIFRDDVHLTPLGSYFMAAVHYGSIFRKSARAARAPDPIDPELARRLQEIAWRHVRAYHTQNAQPGERPMDECRARLASDICPAFWQRSSEKETAGAWFGRRLLARFQTGQKEKRFCAFTDLTWEANPLRWPDPQLALWPRP